MAVDKVVYTSVPHYEKVEDSPIYSPPKGFGVRHTQALVLFISITVGFFLRAHLSVSMVAMVRTPTNETMSCDTSEAINDTLGNYNASDNEIDTSIPETNDTTAWNRDKNRDGVCDNLEDSLNNRSVYQTYNWSKSTQDMIIYSFFVGYSAMMMPMGLVAQRFGGKIPLMIALGVNGVVSILTPWMPMFGGWWAVGAVRLLQGMTQAAFYPSIHTMLGRWAPLSERGRLSSYVYTGSQLGTILAFQLSGLFAGSPSLGWPSIFWLAGLAGLACFCLLGWLGAATPHDHSTISTEELAYITGDGSSDVVPKNRRTPWKHILTSKPVWGMVVTQAGSALSYVVTLTQMPLYMSAILGVDIERNGLFSSLPYIAMYFLILAFGYLSDFCVNRNILSIANVRRVGNSIGMIVSGLFLVWFSYVDSTLSAVILLILYLGTHSGVHVGFHINQIDLAPNFSGPLMALGNTIGNLSGLLAPILVSCFVGNDVGNQKSWQSLFMVIAAIMIVTNMVFLVLVEGTEQPWNFYGDDNTEAANEDKSEIKEIKNAIVITKDSVVKS